MDDLAGRVRQLLDAVDPCGLCPGQRDGAPADEYTSEATAVAAILAEDGSIGVREVDAVWETWFGEPLREAIGNDRTVALVTALNALMSDRSA